MSSSCFFCQNLLSDYVEGILPGVRHEEIKKHLDTCKDCKGVHKDLLSTLDILQQVNSDEMPVELSTRLLEASERGRRRRFNPKEVSRTVLVVVVPVLILVGASIAFPKLFPWMTYFRGVEDSGHFVRYFPLLQGAGEIIDEHTTWIGQKGQLPGSLWEEGGLSPEEFEKSFKRGESAPSSEVEQ